MIVYLQALLICFLSWIGTTMFLFCRIFPNIKRKRENRYLKNGEFSDEEIAQFKKDQAYKKSLEENPKFDLDRWYEYHKQELVPSLVIGGLVGAALSFTFATAAAAL